MHIKHKEASIFYTDTGSGPTIVLLHGFLENKEMWGTIASSLSKTHRIVAIDLLGHGNSSCLGYIHTMEAMAKAVIAVANHLTLKDLTIIGHSMGGYVGLAIAKAYPEYVKALCLLNSTPEKDAPDRQKIRSRANEMAKTNYNQLVRMSVTNLFDSSIKENFEIEISSCIDQALETPVQGYIAANTGMSLRPDYLAFWRSSQIKKGIILGTKDWIVNAQRQQILLKKQSDWFCVLDGGHMLHITNQESTIKALKSFLLV